jgi:hypothetical protein
MENDKNARAARVPRFDDLSFSGSPPKKNAIVPVHESGKDYPEGDPKTEPIPYYVVICPRCKAQAGFPCFTNMAKKTCDYRTICIARVILYEAFKLGSVDIYGTDRTGHTFKGKSWGPE